MSNHDRHLAAILFTDIVGYTAIMQQDEAKAVQIIKHYHEVLNKTITSRQGEILNDYGDGSLCSFPSVYEALNCAIDLQTALRAEPTVPLRVGLHVGEIFFENGKVLGDGVNVASRIQSLGQANTILFSAEILNQCKNHPEFKFISLGKFDFKNVEDPIEVFALANDGFLVPDPKHIQGKLQPKKSTTKKRITIAGILLLVVIVNVLYWWSPEVLSDKADKSIAVLAFRDMSSNHDQEYLSDGIADEIHSRLCKFNDLTVAAMTSSFSFKGKNDDIKSIGKKLNVANILEGTVRKDENNIMITIRLTNAANGFTVMSQSYKGELKNIFSLQQNIAMDIAEKIESQLSPEEKNILSRKEINPMAYEMYLKGRAQFTNGPFGHASGIMKAKKYFEHAVELDTAYSEAYAFLSITYFNISDWAFDQWNYPANENIKRKIAMDSAQLFAEKALSLDPENSGGHLAMGSVYFHQKKWVEVEEEKRKAVALNPGGAFEKFVLSSFLSQFGQYEEAMRLDSLASRLDPLDPSNYNRRYSVLYRAGKFDACIALCQKRIEENPNDAQAFSDIGWCHCGKQNYAEALKDWARVQELSGHSSLAETFRKSDIKSAMQAFVKYYQDKKIPINNNVLSAVYALQKDKENTFKYLNLASESQEQMQMTFLRWNNLYDFIRSDPRFIELYERNGFKAYDDFIANQQK